MDATDLTRVRQAVAGYYRAAGSLGEAALEMRRAALLSEPGPFVESDDVSDREFFLERSAVYTQKALLMSSSAEALLSHAPRWFDELADSSTDRDEVLAGFALAIQSASDAYADTVQALADAGFARLDAYPQLIEELRDSVRFLKMEGAVFAAIANDQLDDGEPDEEDPRA